MPLTAVGTYHGIGTGEAAQQFLPGLGLVGSIRRRAIEQPLGVTELALPVAITEDPPSTSSGHAPCLIFTKLSGSM